MTAFTALTALTAHSNKKSTCQLYLKKKGPTGWPTFIFEGPTL